MVRATWARPPVAKRAAREAFLQLALVTLRGRIGRVLEADEAPLVVSRELEERRAHTRGRKATSARELRLVRAKPYTEQVFLGGARRVVGEQSVGYRQRNGGSTLVIYPRDEPLVLL